LVAVPGRAAKVAPLANGFFDLPLVGGSRRHGHRSRHRRRRSVFGDLSGVHGVSLQLPLLNAPDAEERRVGVSRIGARPIKDLGR
jgi:hypothetical protein